MEGSKKSHFLTIALLSLSLIALEIVWTRIFSAEFFYTFAFLVLSLAILGLGLGALIFHLFPSLNRPQNLGLFLSLTGICALAGPPLVFLIRMDFSLLFNSWEMVGKLIITLFLLSSTYLMGGISLAFLFRNYHRQMPRLYMSDLLGAGMGVLLAVVLMNVAGTPVATFLIALPVLTAAFYTSRAWLKLVPGIATVAMIFLALNAGTLLEAEREEPFPVVYRHWDAMAKIKLYQPQDNFQRLNIDNVAHTGTIKFDGNWDRPDSLRFDFAINMEYLISQFDTCSYLVIGAGGGVDVVQPLQADVPEIHAVEVIPHINQMLLHGELAEFSGYIYHDPRVTVVTEDARAYARRFHRKFDIIYSSSSNTFAALASGAFAMAENYLFTADAFQDYWNALSDSGYMVLEHQVYMPRIVSELMTGLAGNEINDISRHFAVYDWPDARRNLLVLSKRPLTPEIIEHAITGTKKVDDSPFYLLHPASDSMRNNIIHRIISEGWENAADSAIIDISPTTDNRPFIAQMGLWKNFHWNKLDKVIPYSDLFGFPLSGMIVIIILGVVIFLIIPLNLIPYFRKGKKLKAVPWLYFFTIGMAFMMIEIVLMQKYTLFIGSSVYSTVTILLVVLVSSGTGSRFSEKVNSSVPFAGIIGFILLDIFVFGHITRALAGMDLVPRIFVTSALLFPLGFFMGMPFPKGTLKVGELIDWGFAVNGAASVLGSTIVVLIAFSFGFTFALLVSALLYLAAGLFLSVKQAW